MTLTSTILPFFVMALKIFQMSTWFFGCRKTKSGYSTGASNQDLTEKIVSQEDTNCNCISESQTDSVSDEPENRIVPFAPNKPVPYKPVQTSATTPESPAASKSSKKPKRSSSKSQSKDKKDWWEMPDSASKVTIEEIESLNIDV
jgi:hypothetical protein